MLRRFLNLTVFLVILLITSYSLVAQEDILQNTREGTSLEDKKVSSPRKASLYSAALPGAGQIYNQKYWKAPIVWAGMGTFTYIAIDHQSNFKRFKSAYLFRKDGGIDEFYNVFTPEALINEMDRYRRFRDLSIVGAVLFYVIQIVDANVDASLSDFDVSDDISLRIGQAQSSFLTSQQSIGLTFSLKF